MDGGIERLLWFLTTAQQGQTFVALETVPPEFQSIRSLWWNFH